MADNNFREGGGKRSVGVIEPLMLADTPPDSGAEEYTYESLSEYTKAELLEIAAAKGVEGLSMNNLKDEIINAILEAV